MNLLPEQVMSLLLRRNITEERYDEEGDKPFSILRKEHREGEARFCCFNEELFLRFSHAARIYSADDDFVYREAGCRRLMSAHSKTRWEPKVQLCSETIHWWARVPERAEKGAVYGVQEELGAFISEKNLIPLSFDRRWPGPHPSTAFFKFVSSTKRYRYFVEAKLLGLHERAWENNRSFTSEYDPEGVKRESLSILERVPRNTEEGAKLFEQIKALRAA